MYPELEELKQIRDVNTGETVGSMWEREQWDDEYVLWKLAEMLREREMLQDAASWLAYAACDQERIAFPDTEALLPRLEAWKARYGAQAREMGWTLTCDEGRRDLIININHIEGGGLRNDLHAAELMLNTITYEQAPYAREAMAIAVLGGNEWLYDKLADLGYDSYILGAYIAEKDDPEYGNLSVAPCV